ncbi:MAG: orotate phosphoribosyltransferase [Treponema sp.]|nr:orotate phosphoribosyltransferase [Treponema sp.]
MENTLALLRESGAMLEGHFLLSSGRHSSRYFQCAKLLARPRMAEAALAEVCEKIRRHPLAGEISAVIGPAMGGIIVAYEIGRQLGLPAIFAERGENGAMQLRRGFEARPGQKFIIAEDVITTGKSYGECAALLESLGAEVAALACVVDRSSGHGVPWPFFPACKVEAEDWAAQDCALCKAGIPVVKPGSRKI